MKRQHPILSTFLIVLGLLSRTAGAWANPVNAAPVVEKPDSLILLMLGGVGLLAALFGGKIRRSDRF